jgi:acyl-CoA thioester hydrolase
MPAKPFVFETRVRFGDTDASGRIFYASLLRHFDAAETEFLRRIGYSYHRSEAWEVGFPRVHVECDFTAVLSYDDLMAIAVTVESVGRTSFTLAFDVRSKEQPAARGKITIVSVDRQTQRAMPLPEELRAALSQA